MRMVLVSQRVAVNPAHGERRDALDQRWWPFLAACGLLPVPVPNHPDTARALAERIPAAGLLLSGGNDIGAAPERDESERTLLAWAERRGLPVLGVCRGMQMLLHLAGAELEPVPGHAGTRHPVFFDGKRVEVNSYHGFAARSVPEDWRAAAMAEDGVVEAVRHRERLVLGIMWHPEREAPWLERDIVLVRDWFAAGRFAGYQAEE